MACFLVPAAEAVITTIASKVISAREESHEPAELGLHSAHHGFSAKLKWLNNLLWGGSALLLFEHVWHGEITAVFPFLTAAADPAETAAMLEEMATAGVAMSAVVTAVWIGMVAVSSVMEKRASTASDPEL